LFLLVCVCVISNAGASADKLKYYSENDPKIKQISKSVKQYCFIKQKES